MKDPDDLAKNWPELAQRARYSVAALSSMCGLSVRQFERTFRKTVHERPKQSLQTLRLQTGRKMLDDGVSVKSVAFSLGYKRPEHFSRDFRKFYGFSPSGLRREAQEKQ